MTDEHRHVTLLLGPPGAGKGTQARFLRDTLHVPHVASGDLLREHQRRGTPLGQAVASYMDAGDLVPDQLVVDMIVDRLARDDARRGALLDGFPRTRTQAQIVDTNLAAQAASVRAALYLEVEKELLISRIAGRWLCASCQATYPSHSGRAPHNGICVNCGDRLFQRPDDRPDVVQHRIEVYLRETLPVVDHYSRQKLLVRIDGAKPIEEVRAALCMSLGGVVRGRRRGHWHLYIKDRLGSRDGSIGWHGRTLCGKYTDASDDREPGSAESFRADACRRCRMALRARQGPVADDSERAPTPSAPDAMASRASAPKPKPRWDLHGEAGGGWHQ